MKLAENRNYYQSIHHWLRRHFKKKGICCECNKSAKTDWALIKGFQYEKVREHFKELCKSCHIKYDFTDYKKNCLALRMKEQIRSGNLDPATNKGNFAGEAYRKRSIEQYSKNMNYIQTYSNVREAGKLYNILETSISNCLNGRSKSAGGYIWKYKTDNYETS